MSRVSVDKGKLMAIIKEKSECDCTDDDCPLSLDGCKTRPNVDYSFQCNKKLTIIDWLDVEDLPDDSTDEYLLSDDERAL